MKINTTHRRGFTLVELLVVIVIIASLAALSAPMVISQLNKAARTEAISNAKQIGLAMFEFQMEYGSFPDDGTATVLTADGLGAGMTMGTTTANAAFRQLFAADIIEGEEIFYAKTGLTQKTEGDSDAGACLIPGEVGFGYVTKGGGDALPLSSKPRALIVTPLATGSLTQFDPEPFDGKAVIFRLDNAVTALRIKKPASGAGGPGDASLGAGKTLLDTGAGTAWGSITPTVVGPEEP